MCAVRESSGDADGKVFEFRRVKLMGLSSYLALLHSDMRVPTDIRSQSLRQRCNA